MNHKLITLCTIVPTFLALTGTGLGLWVFRENIAEKNIEVIKWIDKNYTIGRLYAAWGTNIEKKAYLVDECRRIVDSVQSEQWFTRGVTKYGHPRHPLYVPYKEKMEWFPVQDYLGSFG